MTTLWLIRHAEADWNHQKRYVGWSDRPLTDFGRAQAAQLHRRLLGITLDALYTSDLVRAIDTAQIALPLLTSCIDADLRELNFGVFDGMTYNEAAASHARELAAWIADPYLVPQDGESLTALGERVGRALARLREQNGTLCVIAHGGSLRVMLCLALGVPLRSHWQFRLDPCAVSRLELYAEGATLSLLNETCHLEKDHDHDPRS